MTTRYWNFAVHSDLERATENTVLTRTKRLALVAILVAGFLTRLPLLMTSAFFSDESVYTYAAYAISRGTIPYKEIMLAHPPLGFLIIAPIAYLSQGNLFIVRLFYLTLLTAVAGLSFVLFNIFWRKRYSRVDPVVVAGILALYPIPFSLTTPLQFSIFDVFILTSVIFFVKAFHHKPRRNFGLAGGFLGISVMVWYPAVFVGIALLSFLIVYGPRELGLRKTGIFILSTVLGGTIPLVIIVGALIASGGFNNFLLQTVALQSSIRNGISLGVRVEHVLSALRAFLPLIVLAGAGGAEIVYSVKRRHNWLALLPVWILFIDVILIMTVPKVVFTHYFTYTTPFMAYAGSVPLQKLIRGLSHLRTTRNLRLPPTDLYQSAIAISMMVMVVSIPAYFLPYNLSFISNNPYTRAEQTVASYISGITGIDDKIWTSEAAIGYLASRLIQAPDSVGWPVQGSYNDIFNASYIDLDGVQQYGFGLLTPSQFQDSWQTHRIKVLVFILGAGPVPYPDELMWNGYSNVSGVQPWVTQNYSMVKVFEFDEIDYTYAVWTVK